MQYKQSSTVIFLCQVCSRPISRPLLEEDRGARDEQRYLDQEGFPAQAGSDWVRAGYFFTTDHGDYTVNNQDLLQTHKHQDTGRWVGCCGAPPEGKPNMVCGSRHEIGRMINECYYPWFTSLLRSCVYPLEDQKGFFEVVWQLYHELRDHDSGPNDRLSSIDLFLVELVNMLPFAHDEDLFESLVSHCQNSFPDQSLPAPLYGSLVDAAHRVDLDVEILALLEEMHLEEITYRSQF